MESEGSRPVAPTVHSYDLRSARRLDDVPSTDARGTQATQESAPVPPRMAADPDQDLGQEQQQQPLQRCSADGAAVNPATVEQSPIGGAQARTTREAAHDRRGGLGPEGLSGEVPVV